MARALNNLNDLEPLHDDEPNVVKVPFPVERAAYMRELAPTVARAEAIIDEHTFKAPVETLPIDDLVARQRTVRRNHVEEFVRNPHLVKPGHIAPKKHMLDDHPVVVQYKDTLFIHEGHHRLTAAMMRGEEGVKVRVVNLDEHALRAWAEHR